MVLVDHLVDDGVDLATLLQVLIMSSLAEVLALLHLVLNLCFVMLHVVQLLGVVLFHLALSHLLLTEHLDLDLSIVALENVRNYNNLQVLIVCGTDSQPSEQSAPY